MRPALLLAVALGLPAPPAAARAEESVRGGAGEAVRAEEIVVEDQRVRPAEVFEDTAVETEVIEAEEIETLPATNAEQIVSTTPGVRTQGRVQGEEAAVSIEGLPPEYTKILVNGQRYTGEIGGAQDLRDVPTLGAGRLTLQRGPQGLRQGPDAAGGVIEIDTRAAPEEGYEARLEASGGSDDAFVGGGHVGLRVGDHGLTLQAIQDQIDGFDPPEGGGNVSEGGGNVGEDGASEGGAVILNRAGGEDSRRLSRDVYGTWRWDAAPSLALHAEGGWRREDEDFVPSDAPDTTNRRDVERWVASGGAEWWATETSLLSANVTWYDQRVDSAVGRDFQLDEDEWKVDAALDQYVETGPLTHAVTAGVDLRRPTLALDEGPLPESLQGAGIAFGDVDESFRSAGLFLISETSWSRYLSLELGIRYELHSEFDAEWVPQAALLLKPHPTLKFRLAWGRNHRNPSLRDLYQPETPQFGGAYFLAGNPELTPESSESYRAGFEWSPFPWVSVAATAFHNDIEDSIRSVFDRVIGIPTGDFEDTRVGVGTDAFPPERLEGLERICNAVGGAFPDCAALEAGGEIVRMPVLQPSNLFRKENLDRVRTRGVEAQLRLRPHERLTLNLAYTLLDTEVIDADRPDLLVLPNQPRHQFDLRMTYRVPWTETLLGFTGRWRDRTVVESSGTGLLSFSNPAALSDPSLLLNARVTQPVTRSLEVFLDVYNLTDERIQDSYAIRGRTILAGVRMRFGGAAREPGRSLW